MTVEPITNQDIFAQEERVFEEQKQDLLRRAEGQYVLIKGDQIVGIFPARIEALEHGMQLFFNQPIYIRRIVEQEEPLVFPSVFMEMQG